MGPFFATIFFLLLFGTPLAIIVRHVRAANPTLYRAQNAEYRALLYRLDRIAHQDRDINPELATKVIDEIEQVRQALDAPAQ